MTAKLRKSYFELANHNPVQIILFLAIWILLAMIIFRNVLPLMDYFFEEYLNGNVVSNGQRIPYFVDQPEPLKTTSYFWAWAVDIYKKTQQESRYWFNPFLSISLQCLVLSLFITVVISALLPRSVGYFRHKIDREIASTLEKISFVRYGINDLSSRSEVAEEIMRSGLQELRDIVNELNIPFENLEILKKALIWQQAGFLYRLMHINDGIKIYMRLYFTVRYSNSVLGFVYIGAAILIIIIGLRGLKFIPPTQPSLVLFALGLEFSILVIYAVTTMYNKGEEENHEAKGPQTNIQLGNEFGNSKEVEKLLRVFIKSDKEKK